MARPPLVLRGLGIGGLVVLAICAAISIETARFVQRAARAEGKVVRLEVQPSSSRGGVVYAPVVTFNTPSEMVTFTSSNASKPASFHAG